MNVVFVKRLFKVTCGHFALILIVFIASGWKYYFREDNNIVAPVEFFVQVDTGPLNKVIEQKTESVEDEKDKEPDIIDPIIIKKKTPKAKDKAKDDKKKAEQAKNKLPVLPGPPKKSPLSAKEIERLLAMGATPDAYRTVIPDEESLNMEMIRRRFYDAWTQPSGEEAGRSVAEGTIWFNANGTIARAELTRETGISAMDASVNFALNSVKEVPGLSAEFLKTYRKITIEFKIGDQ